MIDLQQVGTTQIENEGVKGPWIAVLGDRELYRLCPHTTVQETFTIRDAIQALVEEAHADGVAQANVLCDVKVNRIVENGNSQLDLLKQENARLSAILETTLGEEV